MTVLLALVILALFAAIGLLMLADLEKLRRLEELWDDDEIGAGWASSSLDPGRMATTPAGADTPYGDAA